MPVLEDGRRLPVGGANDSPPIVKSSKTCTPRIPADVDKREFAPARGDTI